MGLIVPNWGEGECRKTRLTMASQNEAGAQPIRMVIADVDGTLVTQDKVLTKRAAEASKVAENSIVCRRPGPSARRAGTSRARPRARCGPRFRAPPGRAGSWCGWHRGRPPAGARSAAVTPVPGPPAVSWRGSPRPAGVRGQPESPGCSRLLSPSASTLIPGRAPLAQPIIPIDIRP